MNAHNTFETPEVVTEQAFADYEKTADGIRVLDSGMQRGKHPSEKITEWLRPEWRAYESVFDYNNKVFRVLGGLADCLILGALWIVCSIPVVTMGAATAAVYHAVNKSIVHGQGLCIPGILHGSESGFETDHRSMAAVGEYWQRFLRRTLR